MSNFVFLKDRNPDLFKIIKKAEKLFRDEYFEECTIQIRRFAENLTRDILQNAVKSSDTFDFMITKIEDTIKDNDRVHEFIKDLYFIKNEGNKSAHNLKSNEMGKTALECLERAYEISIFYHHTKYGYDAKLDEEVFSEELLMTGKKPKKTLQERYEEDLKKAKREEEEKIKEIKRVAKLREKEERQEKKEKERAKKKERQKEKKDKKPKEKKQKNKDEIKLTRKIKIILILIFIFSCVVFYFLNVNYK